MPTIIGAHAGARIERASVEGDDSAWGWNIGVLWDATPQTRVGGRVPVVDQVQRSANVELRSIPPLPTLPPALAPVVGLLAAGVNAVLANGGVKADIELPDIANVSVFHRLTIAGT